MFLTDRELRNVAFGFAIFFLTETFIIFMLGLAFGSSY